MRVVSVFLRLTFCLRLILMTFGEIIHFALQFCVEKCIFAL